MHYVQGVAWDSLGQYLASISSDRTCRIYLNKPTGTAKGIKKMHYVCQNVLSKFEQQIVDDSKVSFSSFFLFAIKNCTGFYAYYTCSFVFVFVHDSKVSPLSFP